MAAAGADFSGALLEADEAIGELAAVGLEAAGAGAGVAEDRGSDALGLMLVAADFGAGAACESLMGNAEFDSGLGRDPAVPGVAVPAEGALEGAGRGFAAGSGANAAPAVPVGADPALEDFEGGAGGTEPRPEAASGGAGLDGVWGSRELAPAGLLAGGIDGADVTT